MTNYYGRYTKPKKAKQDEVVTHRKSGVSMKKSLISKLDKVFSRYIRLRDTDDNGYFKCPTCGRILPFDQADCSHYWSRTHYSTRWNEDNCVVECKHCNRFDSSHLDGLGRHLKKKLGEQRFELLHWLHHQPKDLDEFELATLIKDYQKKVIALAREKNFKVPGV